MTKKRALISVSDKNGISDFAKELVSLALKLFQLGEQKSPSRTRCTCDWVSDVTGFPEILEGRVKTLNPLIHGGLLGKHDDEAASKTN